MDVFEIHRKNRRSSKSNFRSKDNSRHIPESKVKNESEDIFPQGKKGGTVKPGFLSSIMSFRLFGRNNIEDTPATLPEMDLPKNIWSSIIRPILSKIFYTISYLFMCYAMSILLKLLLDPNSPSDKYLPPGIIISSIIMMINFSKPGFIKRTLKSIRSTGRLLCDGCSICFLFFIAILCLRLLYSFLLLQYDLYFSTES